MITRHKKVFNSLFLGFVVVLVILPFILSLNELLTKIVERNLFYIWLQTYIVPVEAKMMGAIILPFGYKVGYSPLNSTIIVNGINMRITWNCLGWQSFLLLFVTLLVGLRGRYTKQSIFIALLIGILGTFWLNIFRMLFTVLLAVHAPAVFRIVFHDYLAAISTVIWLLFFWWFSYSYVLEERTDGSL